tara:strand:- start:9 stop:1217 length:1209 start_codon:yes stop_codon:yes gene_type:complete
MLKHPKSNIGFSEIDWREKTFTKPNTKIRIGSLFSGIGAVEQAFIRLGLNHEIVFAGDIDKFVKESYFANYNISQEKWHEDIKKFKSEKFKGKIDILTGGAPCQPFSQIGKRKGLLDTRGTLFHEFKRVIKDTEPSVFIFENVKGILSNDKGRTWETILNYFNELKYKIYFNILNSKDYGIPQNRQRIFIIGFKDKDTDFQFPKPIKLEHNMQDFLEDDINSKYYLSQKGIKFVTSSRNRKKHFTQINGEIAICQKSRQQFNWHGDFIFNEIENHKNFDEFVFDVKDVEEKYYLSETVKNFVLSPGSKSFNVSTETDLDIARPLLQTMHKMHRAGIDNYVTRKGKIRKLTPRECLRLMGFPDDFKIQVSDTQMYRQAGNSIVVNVIVALLKQMDITKFCSAK